MSGAETGTTSAAAPIECRTADRVMTYCAFRLGDNLHHLHFMRALAKAYPAVNFVHAALQHYLPQMIEVVADLPNLSLRDVMSCREPGINAWKNAGGFWEKHELKARYADFMLVWFELLAGRMGLASPFKTASDLLFDYPALKPEKGNDAGLSLHPHRLKVVPFDFLVVNSVPMSSQWKGFDECALNTLIQELAQRYDIVSTRRTRLGNITATEAIPGFTVTDIGALSLYAKNIIMVSTGPSWPTLNIWNADKFRIVLQDTEELGITTNTHQCKTVAQARAVLKREGLL